MTIKLSPLPGEGKLFHSAKVLPKSLYFRDLHTESHLLMQFRKSKIYKQLRLRPPERPLK